MYVCGKCGEHVCYIACGANTTAICDAEPIDFYTDKGFRYTGYRVHECKGASDAKKVSK